MTQFAANPPTRVTAERAQCLGDEFAAADADQLEAAILSGDRQELRPTSPPVRADRAPARPAERRPAPPPRYLFSAGARR